MTRMMIALAGAAVVLLVAEHAEGFVVPQNQKMPFSTTTRCMALPTPEESAQALSNYMAKSHEEKLRAVKEVEAKTGAEIKALKEEMEVLKAATTSEMVVSGATAPALGSAEEMAAKLAAYQKFMAEYVVKAQESKVIAVQEAEKNAELKFMEKYQLMLGPASTSTPASTTATPVVIGSTVYQVRNAHIQKAAAAGKSRWGDLENQKAAGQVPSRPHVDGVAGPAVPALAKSPSQTIPPQVQEADHGLRADGGVGGLTLAERVTQGASSASAAAPVVVLNMASPNVAYYAKRTASVAAAGMAGKSRWGGMEIAKASSWEAPAMSAASVSVDVEEADHGLRADGGVGGPSLSERVNLGAQLLQSA